MIVGFALDSMNAEKHAAEPGDLNINYRSDITDVEGADVSAVDEAVARIGFDLSIAYAQGGADAATLDFTGNVLWQGDADDLIDAWDNEEELPDEVAATVTNHVFRKCLTQAVGMADALDLPSPVPMPQVGQ